jgi:hypothetical protein
MDLSTGRLSKWTPDDPPRLELLDDLLPLPFPSLPCPPLLRPPAPGHPITAVRERTRIVQYVLRTLYLKIGGRISDYQGNYTPISRVCEIVLDMNIRSGLWNSGTSGELETLCQELTV